VVRAAIGRSVARRTGTNVWEGYAMNMWKKRAAVAVAVVGVLFVSEAAAQSGRTVRMAPDGSGYCIRYLGITESSGYYTARWENRCDLGIWIDWTRVKRETGELVRDETYVSANDTASANLYQSTSISWSERP
jgi:hypothetical protein